MSQHGPLFAAERSKWAWRGLGGGVACGAALMAFLLLVAGKRAELDAVADVLLGYGLLALVGGGLGAALGWFHGGTEATRQLAERDQQPEHWDQVMQDAGMGFRIGLGVALLYVILALGIFLEDRTFPPWLLAVRAGFALVALPVGVGVGGLFAGLSRPR
jgi:hypothetical protein